MQLTATISPADATVDQFKWSSSDEKLATVDQNGMVTGIAPGQVTITATAIDGSGVSGSFALTIIDSNGHFEIADFEVYEEEAATVPVDLVNYTARSYSGFQFDLQLPQSLTLRSVTLGSEFQNDGFELTYKARDENTMRIIVSPKNNLAGVDFTANLLLLEIEAAANAKEGTETINIVNSFLSTVEGDDIRLDNSSAKVEIYAVGDLIISGPTNLIKVSEEIQLTASFSGNAPVTPKVTWSSNNPQIATVDEETGLVCGVRPGTAMITAEAIDFNGLSATYEIEVETPLLGDANDNGTVNVADLVTIADYIAKKEVFKFSFINADVNFDKQITVADINGTVDIIAGIRPSTGAVQYRGAEEQDDAEQGDRLVCDNFNSDETDGCEIAVRLDNSRDYSSLQASVQIPRGMEVTGVTAGPRASGHTLVSNLTPDNTVELVLFSFTNQPFAESDEPLFTLCVKVAPECDDINIVDIHASDRTSTDYLLSYSGGRNEGTTTSVGSPSVNEVNVAATRGAVVVTGAEGEYVSVYDLYGRLVMAMVIDGDQCRIPLHGGVYVVTAAGKSFKVSIK